MQVGRGYNATSLAEHCRVSKRTVFRDLDVLREAGVPLRFHEPDQRYFVDHELYLPPTNFTADEALALIVLCHELAGRRGVPFSQAAQSAAVKLESSLSGRLKDQLIDLARSVQIHLPQTNPLDASEPIYQQLLRATAERRCVRLEYESLTEWETITTKLRPYRMLFSRRSWYVVGHSTLHRQPRTFNVGRIRRIDALDEAFEIPPRFSLERYLRNAWHLIPEPGPDVDVAIRFNKLVAQNVAEVLWHKTQQTRTLDDGSLEFRATVSGINEISWWILGYGDQAEVLAPLSLRELLKKRIAGMAAIYDVEPPDQR